MLGRHGMLDIGCRVGLEEMLGRTRRAVGLWSSLQRNETLVGETENLCWLVILE